MLLQHKNAVIYGGGGAIGGAVARGFTREGAKVFLAGRTLASLEEVARDIAAAGGMAETAEVDALDGKAVDRHAEAVAAKAGGIDIALNAVGIPHVQGPPFTELSFEGAEPSLDEFPREELLALFPEGEYEFEGRTAGGEALGGKGTLTHAVPAPPDISAQVGANDMLAISWAPVTEPAEGFEGPIDVAGYQVIVGPFQVTLPASSTNVTVPPQFVASLGAGQHAFEVLAIDASGNQTIAEGSFETQ